VGLFEPEERAVRLAFTNAIEKLNLANVQGANHMVVYYVEEVMPNDSFEANKEGQLIFVCIFLCCLIFESISSGVAFGFDVQCLSVLPKRLKCEMLLCIQS